MKIILFALLLGSTFLFTGCDTTLVESRPIYRRPVYREGYYGDAPTRQRYYRDDRQVEVVRSYDGSYYRPSPVVRRNVVVVNRPVYLRSRKVNHDDRHYDDHDKRDDKKKKKKKKQHNDD